MSFFNLRRRADPAAVQQAAAPESAETLRRRAKHRLMGSAVLVLAAVVGFPLLFDTQPRPVAMDIPIEIPNKATVRPLGTASSAAGTANASPSTSAPVKRGPAPSSGDNVNAAASLDAKEEIVSAKSASVATSANSSAVKKDAEAEAPATVKPAAKPEPKTEPVPRPDTKIAAKSPASSDEAARAAALLNGGRAPNPSDTDARVVVQVGAFADASKAREARVKLESAGLKTYTQVADTADGKRIRVRVGPFASRGEADKAASKIKALGLSAAVLTL